MPNFSHSAATVGGPRRRVPASHCGASPVDVGVSHAVRGHLSSPHLRLRCPIMLGSGGRPGSAARGALVRPDDSPGSRRLCGGVLVPVTVSTAPRFSDGSGSVSSGTGRRVLLADHPGMTVVRSSTGDRQLAEPGQDHGGSGSGCLQTAAIDGQDLRDLG